MPLRRPLAAATTVAALGLSLVAVPAVAPAAAAPAPPPVPATCDPFGPPTLDATVPTARDVIGFDLGSQDVTTKQSDDYLQAVSAASAKVSDGIAAVSVQGRPLRYAVAGRPEWVTPAGLQTLSANLRAIRDPRTKAADAARLVAATPQVLWIAGNVHGTEESGTDAALRVLYELAARTDCAATRILDEAVVVLLPTQNPDGRELDTRRNANLFDMNRDWFARTQPETDGKLELLRTFPPQLFIDAHEVNGTPGFFFPPNADPVYHEIGEQPLDWIYHLYGPAMAGAFDRFKYKYFNGRTYDMFYMGYGDTVPATGFDAAGMTFEKNAEDPASARVQEQYTAMWASLSAAAGTGDALLTGWRAEYAKAAADGAAGLLEPNQLYYEGAAITNQVPDVRIRHYFLRADDPAKADEVQRLVRRLQRMDVAVYRLTQPLKVSDFTAYARTPAATTLPVGTYWIPLSQYQKHWIHAMLNENTYVPFPYFYDVTAWSLPLLANVPGGRSGLVLSPTASLVPSLAEPAARPLATPPTVAVWQVPQSGTRQESSGWLRWYLDNRLALGHRDVTADDIAGGALAGMQVLVVPDANENDASNALGPKAREVLAQWVRAGGTLVAFRESARLAATLGLTTATWAKAKSDVPGSLLRVKVSAGSALGAGVGATAWTMYEYDDVWRAGTPGTAAVTYPSAGDGDWFVSGYASGADELRGTANVIDEAAGAGRVVLFATDPNYRAFTDGTQRLLRNALDRAGRTAAVASTAGAAAPAARTRAGRGSASLAAAGISPAAAMVVTTTTDGVGAVRAVLERHSASYAVVATPAGLSVRVDLGGLAADEHPWARAAAEELLALGDAVRGVRLP